MKMHEIEQTMLIHGQRWILKLERSIANNCAKAGVSASDIALRAYVHLLEKAKVGGKIEEKTKTADGLYSMMAAKAKWLLWDAVRASQLDHGRKSIRTNDSHDQTVTDENGGDYSPVDLEAALVRWHESQYHDELAYKCLVARMVLDKVCEIRKISTVNQRIYMCVVLEEMPCDEVAMKYGTTKNNVYQIVSRIKKGLEKHGLQLYREIYKQAA